jgi:hypothetical protein
MATRESNVIMFPQRIDPERKEDLRIAEQFIEKIDGLIMKGLRRELAAAEARVWWAMRALRRTLNFCSFRSDTCSVIVTQLGVRLLKYVLARPRWIFRAHDGARARRPATMA